MSRIGQALFAVPGLFLATAAVAGNITANPDPFAFGNVAVNGAAATGTVVLTNSGSSSIFGGFIPGGTCSEFAATAINPNNGNPVSISNPMALGSGQTLIVNVSYDPANRGSDACMQTVTCNCTTQASFQLQGDGIAPVVDVSPSTLDFGNQRWNGGAKSQVITLGNNGDATLNFTYGMQTGTHFHFGTAPGGCTSPGSLAPAENCILTVVFDPASAGAKTDNVVVQSNDPANPTKFVVLSGVGTQSTQTFSPSSSLDFGGVMPGTTKLATLTIGNSGSDTLNLGTMTISGSDATDFSLTDHDCGGQLCNPLSDPIASGASDDFVLSCTPSIPGPRSALLTVASDDPQAPRSIALACMGDDTIFADGFEQ